MNLDAIRGKLRRRAIGMEIGGFHPPESKTASWFGRVNVALPNEEWPMSEEMPMQALCQINLMELPFRPNRLEDLQFIAVFVGPAELPNGTPNGVNWCLRAYGNLAELVSVEQPQTTTNIKPLPMRPKVIESDFPCWEDVAESSDVPEELTDNYEELFKNVEGFKLGGWPTLIQSEIYWAPWNKHPIAPEYVFQIDSTDKGNWWWGDGGVGYFGRGTVEGHKDEWAIEWQCY